MYHQLLFLIHRVHIDCFHTPSYMFLGDTQYTQHYPHFDDQLCTALWKRESLFNSHNIYLLNTDDSDLSLFTSEWEEMCEIHDVL